MKNIYLITLSMLSMVPGTLYSKNLDEARIYINPGHGSWGPNDRPMATIPYPNLAETGRPDTCGFYESNTNLWKAQKTRETLIALGAQKTNIMLSREFNGPFPYVKGAEDESIYNRSLSEICEEVDANNMDYFISIHSNAASEGSLSNYPLFLYRGKDGGDDYAKGSYTICTTAWPYLHSNGIDPMTNYLTSTNIRGDISFYGSSSDRPGSNGVTYTGYLGVMKHGCPGYLSEGYFHTYQPARHRALNKDYCGQEGVRYARGIAQYFGVEGEATGYIMGTIKDMHEKVVHKLFTYGVGSDDQWLPLNGATVELYKAGTKIQEYKVDNNYNGVFVFEKLTPGEYTLNYICEGYKAPTDEYKTPVVVAKNETSYVKAYLESENYVPPTPPEVIYENYPNPVQDLDIRPADLYNFKEEFAEKAIEVLKDKKIRRSILRGDSLYVLAVDDAKAPYVYLINPATQEVIKTLSTVGTVGGIYPVSDIAFTADGVLCGCNMEETQFTPVGTFRVYKWTDYDKAPVEWFTSQKSGNYLNANTGNSFAITGDSKNCKVITSATTTGSSAATRLLIFNIEDGIMLTDLRNQDSSYSMKTWGEDFSFTISPRDDDNLIIDGSNTTPIEYKLSAADVTAMTLIGKWALPQLSAKANGANYFKYGGDALMVAPVADAEGNQAGIALFNIDNGLDKARLIETKGIEITPMAVTYAMGAAAVDNADITLYLVKGGANASASQYTTKTVAQPIVKGIFAYELKVESTATDHTFSFKATDTALKGTLILKDATTDEELKLIDIPNVVKGDNSIKVNISDLPYADKLNWSIELSDRAIARVTKLTENSVDNAFIRAIGVVVNNNPESAHFGKIYVGNNKDGAASTRTVKKGIYAFNPDWTPINTEAYTGGEAWGSNWRMGIDDKGKIYISEWSDGHSGIYIADPSNLEGAYPNLFRNGTRNKDGLFSNASGVAMGGSTTSVSIVGSGADMKLYSFDEDIIMDGKGNNVQCYNLGEADAWNDAPSKSYLVGKLEINGNGHIVADKNGGVWVSQFRSSGNNTADVPSLIYVNAEGKVVFNSGTALEGILDGSGGSGFTVTPDNDRLFINDSKGEVCAFDVTWNEGVPTLTKTYTFKHNLGGTDVYQMNFDYAGNLVISGVYMGIYALPSDDNNTETPASAAYAIAGKQMEIVAPGAPAIVENEDGTLRLNWTAPADDLALTYNVYLDEAKVNTAEVTALSYDFERPQEGSHVFGVTAVYPNGQESAPATVTYTVTSIEEEVVAETINVYPNPTSGLITIDGVESGIAVRIFNANGALVMEAVTPQADLTQLPAGTYFVNIGNQSVRVIKK